MTKKLILTAIIATCLSLLFILNNNKKDSNVIRIGVIIPIEHQAMNDIVLGLEKGLKQFYGNNFQVILKNAQGNQNIMKTIVQQFREQNLKLIVPIGTTTTQMVVSSGINTPVLSLASIFTEHDRKKIGDCNFTAVQDEIDPEIFLKLMSNFYKTVTIIHSTDTKIINEIDNLKKKAASYGINLLTLPIQTISDIYSLQSAIKPSTQALFILKDHLVVSGVTILKKIALNLNIPLISSDEGTVKTGADFAIGVKEYEIGYVGAKVAAKILKDGNTCNYPVTPIDNIAFFYKHNSTAETILSAAKSLNLKLIDVTEKNS